MTNFGDLRYVTRGGVLPIESMASGLLEAEDIGDGSNGRRLHQQLTIASFESV